MTGKSRSQRGDRPRVAYSEFGNPDNAGSDNPALARGTPDLPPHQQQVRVQASRKGRGGKTVTIVSGLQHSPETLKTLLKTLKNQCGTGGTVRDDTLELQGDCAEKLVTLLTQQGYKAKRSGG